MHTIFHISSMHTTIICTTHTIHHDLYNTQNPSQSLLHTHNPSQSLQHTQSIMISTTHNPSWSLQYSQPITISPIHNQSQSLQHTQSLTISTTHTIHHDLYSAHNLQFPKPIGQTAEKRGRQSSYKPQRLTGNLRAHTVWLGNQETHYHSSPTNHKEIAKLTVSIPKQDPNTQKVKIKYIYKKNADFNGMTQNMHNCGGQIPFSEQ